MRSCSVRYVIFNRRPRPPIPLPGPACFTAESELTHAPPQAPKAPRSRPDCCTLLQYEQQVYQFLWEYQYYNPD
eukprot:3292535-Rhodomonas_salina.1